MLLDGRYAAESAASLVESLDLHDPVRVVVRGAEDAEARLAAFCDAIPGAAGCVEGSEVVAVVSPGEGPAARLADGFAGLTVGIGDVRMLIGLGSPDVLRAYADAILGPPARDPPAHAAARRATDRQEAGCARSSSCLRDQLERVSGAPALATVPGMSERVTMIVTTTYLQQRAPHDLVPAREPAFPAPITRVDDPAPEFSRFLYTAVGGDWHWLGRLGWTMQEWEDQLSRSGVETWVIWVNGAPAGYVELDAAVEDDGTHAEIAYFGLLPRYTGRGLGGHLLAHGVAQAWTLHERFDDLAPVSRVWVHTCSLDGPHALANYQARGFRAYRTTETDEEVPDVPIGPRPGAR